MSHHGPQLPIQPLPPHGHPRTSVSITLFQPCRVPPTHNVHERIIQGDVAQPVGNKGLTTVGTMERPLRPLLQTCTHSMQRYSTAPTLPTTRGCTARCQPRTDLTGWQESAFPMVIQANLSHTTAASHRCCNSPYNRQTPPTSPTVRLRQARALRLLTNELPTFRTHVLQPLSGLLEGPWWLREQRNAMCHVTEHVHLSSYFTCNPGQPICKLVVATVNVAKHHLATKLSSHLHNTT